MFVLVLCCLQTTAAAKKKAPIIASREDMKHIGCEVCEKMVNVLKSAIDELKPYKPRKTLMEVQVLEPIESVCNPNNATGEWIRRIDIIESTKQGLSYLKLVEPGGIGKCGAECVTIAKSCQNLLDEELDVDELAQAFLKKTKFTANDFQVRDCAVILCLFLSLTKTTPAKDLSLYDQTMQESFSSHESQTEKIRCQI